MKFSTSRNCSLIEARTLLNRTTCPNSWMIFSPRSTLPRWLLAISSTNRSSKISLSINALSPVPPQARVQKNGQIGRPQGHYLPLARRRNHGSSGKIAYQHLMQLLRLPLYLPPADNQPQLTP